MVRVHSQSTYQFDMHVGFGVEDAPLVHLPSYVYPQISPSSKEVRLMGWYALTSVYSDFLNFGINVSLTCLKATGINSYTRQAPNMWKRYGSNSSTNCYKSPSTVSSVPADLNCLKVPSAHLILDWFIKFLARFQFPLFVVHLHIFRFCCPCPSFKSSSSTESGKQTLNSSCGVSPPVWVHWPSGSLTLLTLLVACFTMISINWHCLVHQWSPGSTSCMKTVWLA